jgi:antitoxin component of MazEF toxin-antitoxin module
MIKKLIISGGSKHVLLPSDLLKLMGVNEYVELTFDGKNIIISKPENEKT